MAKHKHAEAYNLMPYVSDGGGETWWFWNSRDGVTPFTCDNPTTGMGLTHRDWNADRYAPDHIPAVGDWIWVDMTEEAKRALAERMADEGPVKAGDDRHDRDGWIEVFLEGFHAGEPHLVEVTEGMRRTFERQRATGQVAERLG